MTDPERKEVEELAKDIKRIIRKVGFNHNPLAKLLHDEGYIKRPQANNLVKSDEMALREFLWLNHGHTGQYGDDGEMQCQMCCHYQCTDYKREPLSKVINSSIKARFDVNIAKQHC